jgi:hypothetical protein
MPQEYYLIFFMLIITRNIIGEVGSLNFKIYKSAIKMVVIFFYKKESFWPFQNQHLLMLANSSYRGVWPFLLSGKWPIDKGVEA